MTYLHKLAKRLAAAESSRYSTEGVTTTRSGRSLNLHSEHPSAKVPRPRPRLSSVPWWLIAVGAAACQSPAAGPGGDIQQVIVRPSHVALEPGHTTQFNSLGVTPVGDTVPVQATWYATGGTITPAGQYTADLTPGDYVVTASDEQRLWLNDTARVEIAEPADFRLVISPAAVTMAALDSVDFTAFGVTETGDTVSTVVLWSVSEGSIRTQGPQHGRGTFRPGHRSRTQHVIAQDSSGTRSDSAIVTVTGLPAATVAVSPNPVGVRVGAVTQVVATARDSSGDLINDKLFQWTTGNPSIATVSASGVLSGVAPGATTVAATTDGVAGSSAVTVTVVPVGSVTVTPSTASLSAGTTAQLTASVRDTAGNVLTGRVVSWTTSQSSTATVNGSGLVTGVAPGTASIVATCEGKSASATITVTQAPVATVSVAPSTASMVVGGTTLLSATLRDAQGNLLTGRPVTWTSSQAGVATVNGSGLVTGVAAGTATVTATSEGKSGTATITVSTVPVATVTIIPSSAGLTVGSTVQLSAQLRDAAGNLLTGRSVTWTSGQTGIATVSTTGLVTGRAPGSATITASAEGKSGTASVTVTTAPVATVAIVPSTPTVVMGATVQLTAQLRDSAGNLLTGRTVTWTSSQTGVATVNSSGLVSGVAVGTATITATSEGKSGSASLTVTPVPVATVTIVPSTANVTAGATVQLAAQLRDSAGNSLTGRTVTWTSNRTSVATVNGSGMVSGLTTGTATITATSEGKSGSASITVTAVPVATVTVAPSTASLVVGATVQLAAQLRDSGGNLLTGRTVTWSSGQTAIATVNASGLVTGRAAGSATITATSEGKSGTAAITVTVAPVATVTITPSSASVVVGGTTQLSAELRDASGNVLSGRTVAWTTAIPGVATVSAAGLVTGVATGSASITATSEGKSGSATVTVSVPPPPGAVPDPLLLPDATGQAAQTAAYNALSVSTQPAGFSYTDPTTGVKVWKVTSATVPFSNSGMSNDYTDAGQRISQPWQSGGQTYWTIIAYAAFNGSEYWLVDFNKTTGFSNWRHLTGQLRPDVDLCFSFSNNPATPRIAYVINGGSIRRINTETMTVANTGNFPHSGAVTWLQVDRNDAWFVVQSSNGHMAWNSQTNVEYRNTLSYDEARLERDGNYAFLTNVNGGRRWNLADNTVTNSQNWGTTYWAAHMADLRGYWSTVDGYNTTPLGLDVYYANPAGDPNNGIGIYQDVYTGTMAGLTHHSGNWIQDVNDRTQWAFMQDDGGSPPAGKLRNGIAAYRLDGTAFKLVAHHYSTATDYYKEPWATPSPDGRLVLFASNMNGAGSRTDLFLIEMPLR
jgi:uncharacterized protein YjdB